MNVVVRDFIICQLRNPKKSKYHKNFIVENKILAIQSIYKKSPKAYRFLSNLFCLSSVDTVRKTVRHISIKPGINEELFSTLKKKVKTFKTTSDKCCLLLFDEIALQPHLSYSKYEDVVEGFVNDRLDRKLEIANHVAVWMPIAFTFFKNTESNAKVMYM